MFLSQWSSRILSIPCLEPEKMCILNFTLKYWTSMKKPKEKNMNIQVNELMQNAFATTTLKSCKRREQLLKTFGMAGFETFPRFFYCISLSNKT